MVSVCFYFQVHQPFRIKDFRVFDIGKGVDYFHQEKNEQILRKVADKCYLPMNRVVLNLLKHHPQFRASYSFSGIFLDQMERWGRDVLESFQALVDTGRVEILDETYYHSLSAVFSEREFSEQVSKHREKVQQLFGYTPTTFRNTELIYNNHIASMVEKLGYKAILAEGWDQILGWRSPNFVYRPKGCDSIKLLLKNYRLSDDIAFRFSNRGWAQWPLSAETYTSWVNKINGAGQLVNLFMDYETFGEHQWADTGIFDFMQKLPELILSHPHNEFLTPAQAIEKYEPMDAIDIHNLLSWADMERDTSAWMGNDMQRHALEKLYALEGAIKLSGDELLLEDWRKLQTSDHFYYMCTKYFSDGDVHKYFNPNDTPYEAYIAFMNILNDLALRLREKGLDSHQHFPLAQLLYKEVQL